MTPEAFKGWRIAMGLSQEEAAEALGLSRGSILNYERGSRRDDGRPVEVPATVELACDRIALRLAAERGDATYLIGPVRDQVRAVGALIRDDES